MATTQKVTKAKVFGSYNFIDKDPVLDIMRSLVELEAKQRGYSFDQVLVRMAHDTGLSYGCYVGWFYGATRTPLFANLQRSAHYLGVEFTAGSAKKRFPSKANH